MKRISTSALVPGMVTAEDVYNYNDSLLLPKGLILNDKAITKLEFYSIINVMIEDQIVSTPKVEMPVEDSYMERLENSPDFQQFKQGYVKQTAEFESVINNILDANADLDPHRLIQETLMLFQNNGGGHVNMFDMLQNMRQFDDSTYVHCMNVSLICTVFAHWLHMSDEDTETAALCGLLHDIGKTKIPDTIIKKPGKLTEWEFSVIKTHPYEGYRILQGLPVNQHVKNAAIMHHERCDGSGYPLGLPSAKIDSFAKLVSIADVYDAMTSARIYRGPLCPFKVIAIFESEGFQKYDPHYILTFLENVVNTYLLHRVRLTTGDVGEVVYINPSKLSKPTVKVGSKYIDLSKEPHIFIDAII